LSVPLEAASQVLHVPTRIEIRVQNHAHISEAILVGAEREADRILEKAAVKSYWVSCETEDAARSGHKRCREPMETTSFELQIVMSQPPQKTAANSEFGFAVMPSFATVRYDRIAQLTTFDDPRFEASVLLGCVIAHELGHLLLGPNSHSRKGIMLAPWNREQIYQAMRGRLSFSEEEAHRIRSKMTMRTSQASQSERQSN
jgi:hypothetical protein